MPTYIDQPISVLENPGGNDVALFPDSVTANLGRMVVSSLEEKNERDNGWYQRDKVMF